MKKEFSVPDFLLLIAAFIFPIFGYALLNHSGAHVYSLQTSIDAQIPLVPILVIPYIIFIPLYWIVLLGAFYSKSLFRQLAWATIAIYAIAFLFFIFFQTEVIRPNVSGSNFAEQILRFVYAHDNPYNALPSLHVASATVLVSYFTILKASRWWLAYFLLVIVSTLFIHQHYLADVAAGLILGSTVSYFLLRTP